MNILPPPMIGSDLGDSPHEDLGGRRRVTEHGVVHPKGLANTIFFALLGWLFHKVGGEAAQSEFDCRKRKLETGS